MKTNVFRIIYLTLILLLWTTPTLAGGITANDVASGQYDGDPNQSCPNMGTQNPINIATGNKYREEQVYQGPGEFPLEFNLFYNSKTVDLYGKLSGRWGSSYSQKLDIASDYLTIKMIRSDGRVINFEWNNSLEIYSGTGPNTYQQGNLTRMLNGNYKYQFLNKDVSEIYSSQGKLQSIKFADGLRGVHFVSSEVTKTAPSALGSGQPDIPIEMTITVHYPQRNQTLYIYLSRPEFSNLLVPVRLVTPGAQTYSFSVDNGRATTQKIGSGNVITYPFNPRIKDITFPDGVKYVYLYKTTAEIGTSTSWNWTTALVRKYIWGFPDDLDPFSGYKVEYEANYQYDKAGNAIRSSYGAGASIAVDHSVRKGDKNGQDPGHFRSVTDERFGKETYIQFTRKNDGIKVKSVSGAAIGNCLPSNSTYAYDAYGNLNTITQENRVIDYDYSQDINDFYAYGLLDKVAVKDTSLNTLREISYTYAQPDATTGEFAIDDWPRKIKKLTRPNITTEFKYRSGRLYEKTDTDTSTDPDGYIRTHSRTKTWKYDVVETHNNDVSRIKRLVITNPRNITETYIYDINGNLTSYLNHLNHNFSMSSHTEFGLPKTVVDQNNISSVLEYYPRGWLKSITTNGRTVSVTYTGSGLLKRVTLPDSSFLRYSYDNGGRLSEVRNHIGEKVTMDFSTNKDPAVGSIGETVTTKTFDKNTSLQLSTKSFYDALGRVWKNTYDDNFVTKELQNIQYDTDNNPTKITDGRDGQIVQLFDVLGRLETRIDHRDVDEFGQKATVNLAYDEQDRVTSVTHGFNQLATYHYDGFGNLLQTTSPSTGTDTYHYDNTGNVTHKKDGANREVNYTYDLLNRLKTIDYPSEPDVIFIYDAQSTNGKTNYGVGKLTTISVVNGNRIDWIYDDKGNVVEDIRKIDQHTYITAYEYNNANKLIAITYPSGYTFDYNRVDNIIDNISLRNSGKTIADSIEFEPFGPLERLNYGNGFNLSNSHLSFNYRTEYISSGPVSQEYIYDERGDVDEIYDAPGNLIKDYAYDDAGRLNSSNSLFHINYGYSYDTLGNRKSRYVDYNNETYSYDNANPNKLTETIWSSGFNYDFQTYSFDSSGRMQSVYNDGFERYFPVSYSLRYNENGRLSNVHWGSTLVESYTYNALGQRNKKLTTNTYRNDGERHFTYGLDGKLLHEANSDQSWTRDYIYLDGRLIAFNDITATWSGLYIGSVSATDSFQNGGSLAIDSATTSGQSPYYTYRSLNGDGTISAQIPAIEGSTAGTEVGLEIRESIDANANFVRVSRFAKQPIVLISADIIIPILLPQENALRVTYKDATGEHVIEHDAAAYQYFKLDATGGNVSVYASTDGVNWQILGSPIGLNISNGAVVGFYADDLKSNTSVNFQNIAYSGGVANGSQLYYVHSDHLGTPLQISDSNQQIVWSAEYEPFGKAWVGVEIIENNIRFPGQYYDVVTDLHYNYYRYYEPETGRYISSDPIGLAGGLNTYGYVGGNPVNAIDPLGLASCVYSITGGNLFCISNAGKNPNFVGPPESRSLPSNATHSGRGIHKNNPSSANMRDWGPIPPGVYDMFLNELPNRQGLNWWTLKDKDWISGLSALAWRLHLRRSGHNLHIGERSKGCITVSPEYQDQYDALTDLLSDEAGDNQIVVVR